MTNAFQALLARPLSIGQVVHVEAKWPVDDDGDHLAAVEETRWLLGLPFGEHGLPELGGLVVGVDPRWRDAGDVLDAHLAAIRSERPELEPMYVALAETTKALL